MTNESVVYPGIFSEKGAHQNFKARNHVRIISNGKIIEGRIVSSECAVATEISGKKWWSLSWLVIEDVGKAQYFWKAENSGVVYLIHTPAEHTFALLVDGMVFASTTAATVEEARAKIEERYIPDVLDPRRIHPLIKNWMLIGEPLYIIFE